MVSLESIEESLNNAMNAPEVQSIVLDIQSPGGSALGLPDTADRIFEASQQKPIVAFIDELGCSAAYFLACQADKIVATQTSIHANIGTYAVLWDMSKLFEECGVRPVVIKSGKFKAIGVPGTEISDSDKEEVQRMIDHYAAQFVAAVARGRQMAPERAAELADGRCYVGEQGVSVGLIDAVQTFDEMMESLAAELAEAA